jgi:putative endonuclease
MDNVWLLYILQCADGTLYTGITNNLELRLEKHTLGTGAKYTKGRGPFKVIYTEECTDRSEASKREREVKGMSRVEKLGLVKS